MVIHRRVRRSRCRRNEDGTGTIPSQCRRRRDVEKTRQESQAREKSGDDSWDYPAIQGMNCPVVLVVEDTESFDARVLDSLLRSVSEFATAFPPSHFSV